jgi:hypothetical protein
MYSREMTRRSASHSQVRIRLRLISHLGAHRTCPFVFFATYRKGDYGARSTGVAISFLKACFIPARVNKALLYFFYKPEKYFNILLLSVLVFVLVESHLDYWKKVDQQDHS